MKLFILLIVTALFTLISSEMNDQVCVQTSHTIAEYERKIPTWTTYADFSWNFSCMYYTSNDLWAIDPFPGINPILGVMNGYYASSDQPDNRYVPNPTRGYFTNQLFLLNKTSNQLYLYQNISVFFSPDLDFGVRAQCFHQDGDPRYSEENYENQGVQAGDGAAVDFYVVRNPAFGVVGRAQKIEGFWWSIDKKYSESILVSFNETTGKYYEELRCKYVQLGPYPPIHHHGRSVPDTQTKRSIDWANQELMDFGRMYIPKSMVQNKE